MNAVVEHSQPIPVQTSRALVLEAPGRVSVCPLVLREPRPEDVLVAVSYTGISTGTEKLLFSGEMPAFPGLGYPLVPGYEAVGTVIWAGPSASRIPGERVFVPGANCFEAARGLFGASASHLLVPATAVVPVAESLGERAVLLALAATAEHALAVTRAVTGRLPELVVGHGVVGRLLARLTTCRGAAPTVWEIEPARRAGASGYEVSSTEEDARTDYEVVIDASGDPGVVDQLLARLAHSGQIVLAGFYPGAVGFDFPGAFRREARIAVAAEFSPEDLAAVSRLVHAGTLSLDGLISHVVPADDAVAAYAMAFEDRRCLKMVLDWRNTDSGT